MNQDQVKLLLLSIEEPVLDFQVIFSGKKSKKVNGLYKIEEREIILHNKNFANDNLLIYTAIHEYAHHLHNCKNNGLIPARVHTTEFWAIFHDLLEKAEKKKLYSNAYEESKKLNELTNLIREKYIKQNGTLFIELGKYLLKAQSLCDEEGLRFEDYIDRILCIPRLAAKTAIKSFSYNLNPSIGPDNMRFLSNFTNPDDREIAQTSLLTGKSPDLVKMSLRKSEEDPCIRLEKEKNRLIRTIDTLSKRLKTVEIELSKL
ncbi:MAG: hypothetical protein LBD07_06740 [Spirochaetaceae bacterium]|jgi:hypothetical protein|nr:hypothetical protein [Spirochaetaceae bacterium]